MRIRFWGFLLLLGFSMMLSAQEKTILVPKQVPGAPFELDDQQDLFGQAYRWFWEGEVERGAGTLKQLIVEAGFAIDPDAYYLVVAHFTDYFVPMGLLHKDEDFFNTRLYGLQEDNLYYIFISRTPQAPSFLSALATAKDAPFVMNLDDFLGLIGVLPGARAKSLTGETTWVDVRQFTIPKKYRKFSDLSVIVKKSLEDDKPLVTRVYDNTAKERWSYGIALGLTTVRDVDIVIGEDGRIIIQPKPNADLTPFGVINYHFKPVDTKAKTFGNSIHLLGGVRLGNILEPIVGLGGGVSLGFVDVHAFVGYSVEFANQLKEGFVISQQISEDVDPFKLKLRGKPRFGLEIKFP